MVMIQASLGEVAEQRCCTGHPAAFGGRRTVSSLGSTLRKVPQPWLVAGMQELPSPFPVQHPSSCEEG